MGTNPRKFSEKIAMHQQRQAAETQEFEQIMREVMETVTKPIPTPPANISNNKLPQTHLLPINLPNFGGSLPNVNQIAHRVDKGFNQNSGRSSSRQLGPGPVRVKPHRTDHSPYASPPSMSHSMSSNPGVNLGSPGLNFGSNYLSPPSDASWRRANSDSALHSLMIPSVVPDSSEESSNNSNDPRDNYGLSLGKCNNESPNTSTVGDGSLLEIPPSASTGSLPDLTNFQFQHPLQQPVDMEEQQLNHSPYSTSPLTGSSLTYSPTSLSPHPPSGSVMTNHQTSQQHQGNQSTQQQQQQSPVQKSSQQQQQHPQSPHSPQQQQPLLENPLHVNTSFQNFSPNDNMLTAYRSPTRPSPQSSPLPFRSASPIEGHISAPGSPTNQPSQQTIDSYYLSQQAQALQQHFEQISMMETSPQRNNGHWQGGGMVTSSPYFYSQAQQQIQTGATAGITAQQQSPQPQTPQTPSSIPDIIFTDFSEVRSTDSVEDFLLSEAAAATLREGLGPIDLDGLEMLRDSTLIPLDPNAEDTFRDDFCQ